MIDPALHNSALRGVHFMITQARFLAYSEEPNKRIADLLDDAEYLLVMLFEDEDRTETFLSYLESSAKDHQCMHAYHLVEQQLAALKT